MKKNRSCFSIVRQISLQSMLVCLCIILSCKLSALVSITGPMDNSTFDSGEEISFSGKSFDPEDGELTGTSLVWTSDQDGKIGTGNSFTREDLSEGVHTITLTATDSDNETVEDAVYLTVLGSSVASDITLSIYSNGWGDLLETKKLQFERSLIIDSYEEYPYGDISRYKIYAEADEFYTEISGCSKGDRITVDLDPVPASPNSITGVIFVCQRYFGDHSLADADIELLDLDNKTIANTTTDARGRYVFSGLEPGSYVLQFTYADEIYDEYSETFRFDITNTSAADYNDISFYDPMQLAKPNIYLYPEEETFVDVKLVFPNHGHVTVSDPPYNDGWQVSVNSDGIIDSSYEYLFYEASVIPEIQSESGWLLNGYNLELELRDLLLKLGFFGREIDDFIDFWLPEIGGSPWYAVYPQDLEKYVNLDILPKPDSILRIMLFIRELNVPIHIPEPPEQEPFVREGFVIVEWGVVREFYDGQSFK